MRSEILIAVTIILCILHVISFFHIRKTKQRAERTRQKWKEEARLIAYTDQLTGLPNRLAFMESLEHTITDKQQGELLAILDMDLDNFKDVNDTMGHLYGDCAIEAVANRLQGVLGEQDLIGRVGGDEFIIMLRDVGSRLACEELVLKIMRLFEQPFQVYDHELLLSVSMGVVIMPFDGCTTLKSTIRNLDAAMQMAKEKGKNNYRFFDRSMEFALKKRMEIQADLLKAIEENQFELYYQPQINLSNDEMTGFEALVRWNHPKKGIIMPADFIPVAEESGLIVAIGKIILSEACRQLYEWQQDGYDDVMVAVNLSAKQFKDPFFMNNVQEILKQYPIDSKRLELEITESIALDDVEYSIRTIRRLRQLGITFSLDDFGTGYSSLSYLRRLPINNIKIDKSFVDSVMESCSDKHIVETIIQLAQILNLSVIAEGVEEKEQETFLKEAKCDKAQGFLYSRPITGASATALLR